MSDAAPFTLSYAKGVGRATPRWLHAYAVTVMCATFALIIAGGIVTTRGAGLAVPDWPLSYGQLMPERWYAVGNIAAEHSHRMIAGTVALLMLGLAICTQAAEPRRSVRILGWAALAAVIAQALLGGATVLILGEIRPVIRVCHAALAQTFFMLTISLAVVTSRWWQLEAGYRRHPSPALQGGKPGGSSDRGVVDGVPEPAVRTLRATPEPRPSGREARPEGRGSEAACSFHDAASMPGGGGRALGGRGGAVAFRNVALTAAVILFVQLMLGAVMRHTESGLALFEFPTSYEGRWLPPTDAAELARHNEVRSFDHWLGHVTLAQMWFNFAHRAWAVVVTGALAVLAVVVFRRHADEPRFVSPTIGLIGLLFAQIALGVVTVFSLRNVWITTLHVGTGVLMFAFSFNLVLRAFRIQPAGPGNALRERQKAQPVAAGLRSSDADRGCDVEAGLRPAVSPGGAATRGAAT